MRGLISFLLGTLFAVQANAGVIPGSNSRIANWLVGAYTDDNTQKFDHCGMSTTYVSGITMGFAVSENMTWRVFWAHPSWNLVPGQQVIVELHIDTYPPVSVSATARTQTMALAELPPTAVLFDQFRKGIQLTAFAQGNRYDFRLDGTYAALTEIGNCALRYSGRTPPASAPPAPMASSTPAPPMGQPLSAEQRLEATTLVANLFSQGELTGYKILSAKDIQELRLPTLSTWHVVWRAGDIVGTMRIVPPQSAPSAGAISSDIIGSDSKGCTGKFASGTNPDDKNQGTTRIFTACRTEMFLTEGHYIIVPREAGGYYLFGTFGQAPVTATGGGTKGTSEATSSSHADGLLRAAVFEVLKH